MAHALSSVDTNSLPSTAIAGLTMRAGRPVDWLSAPVPKPLMMRGSSGPGPPKPPNRPPPAGGSPGVMRVTHCSPSIWTFVASTCVRVLKRRPV